MMPRQRQPDVFPEAPLGASGRGVEDKYAGTTYRQYSIAVLCRYAIDIQTAALLSLIGRRSFIFGERHEN